MENYLAHVRRDLSGQPAAVQTVSEHCRNAARHAAQALEAVSLSDCGYLAGLLHDMGKYTGDFQNYLVNQIGQRGSVNHTFAGVRLLLERFFREDAEDFSGIASELLALAVGGHHGLFDCVDDRQKSGFQHRLNKEGIGYEEAEENFLRLCVGQEELDRRFQAVQQELAPVLEHICSMTGDEASDERYDQETAFYSGLLARLLLSAVIEGDRRDTAIFMNEAGFPPARSKEELEHLWLTLLSRVEERVDKLPQNSPIDQARRTISDQCRKAAEQPGGVFRLNVPTGRGKPCLGCGSPWPMRAGTESSESSSLRRCSVFWNKTRR